MENPAQDIYKAFHLIDSVPSAELQKVAVERFFLADAGFKNPFFQIPGGPGSRDRILKLYQCGISFIPGCSNDPGAYSSGGFTSSLLEQKEIFLT